MESTCIFCEIANGDIKSDILYQDAWAFVIRDLSPRAPVHLLIIPIQHIESLSNESQTKTFPLGHLLHLCEEMAISHNLFKEGFRITINQGENAGQTIPHLHFHLIGGRNLGPEG